MLRQSLFAAHYEKTIDRESAYERLKARAGQQAEMPAPKPTSRKKPEPTFLSEAGSFVTSVAKSTARSMGTQVGRELIRGVLGILVGWLTPTP